MPKRSASNQENLNKKAKFNNNDKEQQQKDEIFSLLEDIDNENKSEIKKSQDDHTNIQTEAQNEESQIELRKLIDLYYVLITHLCRDCQNGLYKSTEKLVREGDNVILKINMCSECAVENINARKEFGCKKLNDKLLWKMTKPHFVLITHLCIDCNGRTLDTPDSVVKNGDRVTLKLSMCLDCAKTNIGITEALAPWKPEQKKKNV